MAWAVGVFLLNALVVIVHAGATAVVIWQGQGPSQGQALLYFIPIVPSIISALILAIDRPRTVPGPVFLINAVLFLVELAILAGVPGEAESGWPGILVRAAGICLPFASLLVMFNMPLRDPLMSSDGIGKPLSEPTSSVRSPEDLVTLWQWMSVSWMAPLISIGYKRQLHDEDVWFLAYEFQHSRLHLLFRELTGSVFVRLLKANGLDLIITTFLGVLETLAELAEPVLLKQLLGALSSEPSNPRTAVVYAGLTLLGRLARAQSGVINLWYCRRNYERTRGEMITMIYEKTLRRKAFTFPSSQDSPTLDIGQEEPSGVSTATTLTDNESDTDEDVVPSKPRLSRFSALKTWFHRGYQKLRPRQSTPAATSGPASTGKILNLLRNDVYEVAQRFWEVPSLITKPLNFVVSIVLIWRILGPASLSGIVILIAGMAFNVSLMRMLLAVERVRRGITDVKLQRTSQFVESIRHLRWYDWQGAWLAQIMESRQAELMKRMTSNIIMKCISFVNTLTAFMFPVAGFLAYTVVSGRPLTVDVAFPALELFGMLQNSLRELPDLITVLLNARVAMDRIERFMVEPDKENTDEEDHQGPPGDLEIVIKDASFSWPGSDRKVLRDVSIKCKPGLTVICGKVGIGKTAMLQAILGELDQHGGEKIIPHEMVGYSAQTAWLESMSIRENILFSTAYDEVRYRQVIDTCCLRDDINEFKSKDSTLIGENGVGLSGGQRARVALARAIYSRARILLLDDPIAALDHQTAASILGNMFADKDSPLTAGRLIMFVTHRVDIITKYSYQVLDIVNGGRVKTFNREELDNNEELEQLVADVAVDDDVAAAKATAGQGDGEGEDSAPDTFIEEEHRAHGGVVASVYWQYVKAGKLGWWVSLILSFVLFRLARVTYFWFLKEWAEHYESTPAPSLYGFFRTQDQYPVNRQSILLRQAELDKNGWIDLGRYLPSPSVDVHPWLFWFFVISLVQVLAHTLSDITLIIIVYKAGKNLFEQAMRRVSNATFRFYDVTPVGRLMNRVTSDMGTVDGQIANQLMQVAWYSIGWLSSIMVIATATPLFLVLSVAMTAVFILIFNRFLPASQSLRRLETVSLSPLMSNFGTLVEGLTTVRAFRAEPHFQRRIIATTDAFQKMDHIYWSLQAWLQYRFDLLSALTSFALTLTAIFSGLSGGAVGFVLAAASNLVQNTHNLCRRYGEMQMTFVSVERVIELLDLEQEPNGTHKPPASWPAFGDDIVFDHVTLRYAPTLDPVLMDVSFTIPGGANVAVTGRTGSGKSTLALSLLGTLHPEPATGGTIHIGNIDLAEVDKHALRRNITFVAQDPVLFPGSLRDNFDPLDEHGESERADVLERVLGGSDGGGESHNSFTLDSRIDGGGKNLSQGQRQLIGLGRAILRRSPVVIMDEATASIDADTASYIQRLLREELKYSTVITIAHKAEAVQDADFEIVLDKGKVVRAGPRGGRDGPA
ncbi:P-loop containing nucleoside triphosphate hydrolase protein [Podospora appendiculata]|uniref:P-loop containing nucleoside triphosphate hydrolase protein n=1 Tax=Podospora appendiculata TaxID=314037 RepID=A0AAE0X930_9PEZI|nr:P-loop containing nucleoside triphosphate hydrolase protein [Podospora appendiculata]